MKYIILCLLALTMFGCQNLSIVKDCQAEKDGFQFCHYTADYDVHSACNGSCDSSAHKEKVQ